MNMINQRDKSLVFCATQEPLKRLALVWVACGVLIWAQAMYESPGGTCEVRALAFPMMIIAWPLRVYFLTQPRSKHIPLI